MQVPSKAELERFFRPEQAAAVRFVETVASWPSLRILDYLYRNEPASTGDIARELNMDMRDVKDRLDGLAEQGAVGEGGEGWTTTVDSITITLAREDGLDITHSTGDQVSAVDTNAPDSGPGSGGVVARVRRAVGSLFQ